MRRPLVRFGIIACSSIARRRMLPAISASLHAQVGHIGSRSAAKAREFAAQFDVKRHGSYEDVLADPEVDAVYISTPPCDHARWTREAILRRKHVLCEKPAFSNLRVAEELVRLARENNVRLMEGYMFRHHPQHTGVQSMIRAGQIGEPRLFTSELTYPRPPDDDIRLTPELDGGVFSDAAGYGVAGAQLVFASSPVSVSCTITTDSAARVDNFVSMTIRFAKSEIAQLLSGFGLQYRSRYAVLGSGGRIEAERAYAIPADRAVSIVLEKETGTEKIVFPPVDQFRLMLDCFTTQLLDPSTERCEFEGELLGRHRLMDAARRSWADQRTITLAEVIS